MISSLLWHHWEFLNQSNNILVLAVLSSAGRVKSTVLFRDKWTLLSSLLLWAALESNASHNMIKVFLDANLEKVPKKNTVFLSSSAA